MSQPSRARRAVAGAAVSALAFSGVVALSAAPAGALPTFDYERIFGANRYETSAQVALEAFPDGSDTVIIARGDLFADALAGSYLTPLGPVLLTESDDLPQVTADAIGTLGATEAIVLGGSVAVNDSVVAELEALDLDVTRVFGATREATAAAVASFDGVTLGENADGERTAIVVRSDNFADALAFGPLAASQGFPVLLTDSDTLSPETADALEDLDIEAVIIGGGTAAVSQDVADDIEDVVGDGDVARLFGSTRYETAAAAAAVTIASDDSIDGDSVVLARGDNAGNGADALSGVALALNTSSPIVLTPPSETAEATLGIHTLLAPTLVEGFALGGTAAIAPAVVEAYEDAAQTAVAVVQPVGDVQGGENATFSVDISPVEALDTDGIESITVTGDGVQGGSVVVDGDDLDVDEDDLITLSVPVAENASGMSTFTFDIAFADDSDGVAPGLSVDVAVDVLEAQDGLVDNRPELVSVSSVQDDDDNFVVTYTFDQGVVVSDSDDDGDSDDDDDDLDTDDFVLIEADGSRTTASAAVLGDDGVSVVATFDADDVDDTNAENVRLAAVEFGAVASAEDDGADDISPLENALCSLAISLTTDRPDGTAGITVAPDLVGLGNIRTGDPDTSLTLVDVTFDEAVAAAGPNDRYVLVVEEGNAGVTPTSATVNPTNRNVVTLTFDDQDGVTVASRLADGDFPRFYVREGGATDAAGNANVLQSIDLATGGNTDTPDLVTATFLPSMTDFDDPGTTVDETQDLVTFTFDENINPTVINDDAFQVYDINAQTFDADEATRTSSTTVVAEFAPGTLASAVGASLEVQAVSAADGDADTQRNVRDEVGVDNPSASLGTTDGPDLQSVTVSRAESGLATAEFMFDEDVDAVTAGTGDGFALYLADGTKLVPTGPGTVDGSSVTFSGFEVEADADDDRDGDDASDAEVFSATLGTVDDGNVTDGTDANPEGCAAVVQGDDESPQQGSANTEQPQVVSFTVVDDGDDVVIRLQLDEQVDDDTDDDGDDDLDGDAVTLVGVNPSVTLDADDADVDGDDASVIVATFDDTEPDDLRDFVLVTLERGVVDDELGTGDSVDDGDDNLPFAGAFSFGDTANRTGSPGRTDAPDLVSIGNFRQSDADLNDTLVDFTFDEGVAAVGGLDRFVLVRDEGDSGVTPSAVAVDPDDPTVVTATFGRSAATAGGPQQTVAAQQANGEFPRGYVRPGGAADADGNANPLEGFDITGGGITGTPDLTGATVVEASDSDDPLTTIDESSDRVVFTFDEDVTNPDATAFQVAGIDGDETDGVRAFRTGSGQVTVEFPDGAVADAVVASIETDGTGGNGGRAVQSTDDPSPAGRSVRDAVALDNDNTDGGPGFTAGPDLVSVAVSSDGTADFTFDDADADADGTVSSGSFYLVLEDGTVLQGTTDAEDGTEVVTITSFTVEGGGAATTSQVAAASFAFVLPGGVTNEGGFDNPLGTVAVDGSTA